MFKSRFSLVLLLITIFISIQFMIRSVLLIVSFNQIHLSLIDLIKIYAVGLFYDFVTAIYFVIPFVIYLILMPSKIFYTSLQRYFLYCLLFFITYLMIFGAVSEYFFWDEFGKRFNFIAVDYLVYTHEVIHNILESYPIPLLLSAIFIINLLLWYFIIKKTNFLDHVFLHKDQFKSRVKSLGALLILPLIFFFTLDQEPLSKVSKNTFNNELAKNGIYALFSAFRHNELDYLTFYKSLPHTYVMQRLYQLIGIDEHHRKYIRPPKGEEPKKLNIMLVMIESMSAEYMGIFGNDQNLTPFLDSLAKRSLFFDHFFATGTRTVRGMEAVTLSVPPTPGRSIVKRPDVNRLYNFGFILQSYGYENKFIYGGYGYFDNMNAFFSSNGFKIVDRASFKSDEISFSNVWGVCDEDLFNKALKEADKSYAASKPFFNFLMTTSNHRPYTYPEGKISIPSHTGRPGGVRYTDYAIEEFLNKAKKKPWFDNTIFIFVADHNGGSAGKTSLPLWRYKIPLIIYAPRYITPKTIHKVSSQVDLMPTVLSLMHMSYYSFFYGENILDPHFHERAFIGNYQKLGFYRNEKLTILTPDKKYSQVHVKDLQLTGVKYESIPTNEEDLNDTITFYQSASYFYKNGIDRWDHWPHP